MSLSKKLLAAGVLGTVAIGSVIGVQDVKDYLKSFAAVRTAVIWMANLRAPAFSASEAGNGGPAAAIKLHDPVGLARARSGEIYIGDRRGVIWEVDAAQTARIIAGTGRKGIPESGEKALEADLGTPEGMALDRKNRLHFADSFGNAVFRIEADGTLTRVAGQGVPGDEGDGSRAVDAFLNQPYDVCFDSTGNLYVADVGNHRIRKITPEGFIETAAGTGEIGYTGDAGPAIAAALNTPYGIAIDALDRLLVADSENHVVRRIDENGVLSTIAGTGQPGYSGDGQSAKEAELNSPQFLMVESNGRIFVGDEHNNVIRVIEPQGNIHTYLGKSPSDVDADADGVSVTGTPFNDPERLLALEDGSLLIADGGNARIRIVDGDGQIRTFAGGKGTLDRDARAQAAVP